VCACARAAQAPGTHQSCTRVVCPQRLERARAAPHSRPHGRSPTLPRAKPQLGYGEAQMLDKLLYEEEVKRCMACFEQQVRR
jgi:hypothetical protein